MFDIINPPNTCIKITARVFNYLKSFDIRKQKSFNITDMLTGMNLF